MSALRREGEAASVSRKGSLQEKEAVKGNVESSGLQEDRVEFVVIQKVEGFIGKEEPRV